MSAKQSSADPARDWVKANSSVVDRCFQYYVRKRDWPSVLDLQRELDQAGIEIEVQEVADAKPAVANQAISVHAETLSLQIRHLMWLENAEPLVDICINAIRHAADAYLSLDERPQVSSAESLSKFPSAQHNLVLHAYGVLSMEHPSPFGGSGRSDGSWTFQVDPRFARYFRDVETARDFVAAQDSIREEAAANVARLMASSGVTQSNFWQPGGHSDAELDASRPLLFISWGKEVSKQIGFVLQSILKDRLKGVEVFFSPTSIEPGKDPSLAMFDEALLIASALVVVLTKAASKSEYVIWETATAWALQQLVIPVFVDVSPSDVAGPLANRVQGVRMKDRADLDRALISLCARFGVSDDGGFTDDEYESLVRASSTPDASAQQTLDACKRDLNGLIAKRQVEWLTLNDGYHANEALRMMALFAQELSEVLGAVSSATDGGGITSLKENLSSLTQQAFQLGRSHFYMDGGRSWNTFTDGASTLFQSLANLSVSDWSVEP